MFMRPLNFDTELQKKEHLFGNTNRCFCIFKSKNSLKKMGVFLMMFHVRQKSNLGKKIRNFYNVIYGFWSVKGVRGIFPLWAIFTDFPSWEICKKSGCGRPQAVLAIRGKLPVGSLRVLGCIGSLFKTLMGVSAHFQKTVKHSDFRIWFMTI